MSRLSIHLNDAGVTAFDGTRILYRQPGYVYLGDESLETGTAAFGHARLDPRRIQHRFWMQLDTEPLGDTRFRHLSAADLASRQLEAVWREVGAGVDELVIAAPAFMTAEKLGLLLGIARELGLPVVSMVDAAVAATRRQYRGGVPVHLDVALHSSTLTRMAQPEVAQSDRSEVLEDCGMHALYDAWINMIAEQFVRQSRFDPLHRAETEQALYDGIADWINLAANGADVAVTLQSNGVSYDAEIPALEFVSAAAPVYQQITARLRPLLRAEDVPALQMSDRASRLPGLADMLKARVGGEVFILEPGATARGAFARCRAGKARGEGIALLRQLPWDQAPVELQQRTADSVEAGNPTHLLYGHNAYSIGAAPLVIGTQADAGSTTITVQADMPGVSRRHCSLMRRNGQCVVEDHSRYGTFLNGHRIDGSSVLQVGDALRVGSPGFEFQLITTEVGHG